MTTTNPASVDTQHAASNFAGQDFSAFAKASKEEADSIIANCNIKICIKLEDDAPHQPQPRL